MFTVVSPAPLAPRTSVTRTACERAAVFGNVIVADQVWSAPTTTGPVSRLSWVSRRLIVSP